jgi:hypothetical protein
METQGRAGRIPELVSDAPGRGGPTTTTCWKEET